MARGKRLERDFPLGLGGGEELPLSLFEPGKRNVPLGKMAELFKDFVRCFLKEKKERTLSFPPQGGEAVAKKGSDAEHAKKKEARRFSSLHKEGRGMTVSGEFRYREVSFFLRCRPYFLLFGEKGDRQKATGRRRERKKGVMPQKKKKGGHSSTWNPKPKTDGGRREKKVSVFHSWTGREGLASH